MTTAADNAIAIDASYVLVPEGDRQTVVEDKTVVITGDRIGVIADTFEGAVGRRINARGKLVMPGFVNGHVHAGTATYVRGLAEDRDLLEGTAIYHYAVPLLTVGYQNFTPDEFAAVLEWDILELVKKGSTTILEESFGGADVAVDIVERLGNRAYISATYPGQVANIGYIKDGKLVYDQPAVAAVEAGFEKGIELHRRYNGAASDRVRVRLSPTGPDTCPPEILRATRDEADRLGCGISIHAAHHSTEIRFCLDNFDASPIGHLANTGVLGSDALVTHVTFTDDDDRRLLAETGSTVVHCPVRKAREAVITPFAEYVEGGINVALGTDSYSSDIVETIKATAQLGKIKMGRVGVPTAQDVIDAATLAGARGLGRDDLGRIEAGAKADLIIVDLQKPHNFPIIDPLINFVHYSFGSDVETVIVDGRVIVEGGVAVNTDEEALRERVRAATARIYELGAQAGAMPSRAPARGRP